MSEIVRLDIPLLVPDLVGDEHCPELLTEWILPRKGIEQAHIVRQNGHKFLCLHFDPNQTTLGQVERLAHEAGTHFSARYRHETIPFAGMDAADTTQDLGTLLSALPGMLHARANYAAGLIFVAYDSEVLTRASIEQTICGMGARLIGGPQAVPAEGPDEAHAHEGVPSFLPHWMQERWELLLVALAGLFFAAGWLGERYFGLSETAALVLYILAYLAGGYDIATHAIPGLLRGKFNTDVLMLAAAAGAAVLGEWAEGAFLLFLFSLGHAGEHYALDRARNAINALGELMPQTARVRRGGQIVELPVEQVQVGDLVVVRPGDRIAVDGEVAQGQSSVDQSPITGESVPVQKGEGDELFAGTINQDAALEVRVTRLAADNTLARVMTLVAEAQSQTSPTQQSTERFTRWFVPAVLIGTFLFIVVPPLAGWMAWNESFYRGMLLLVAASPCALAIGTPATVLAGIAQAARNGVLIKGGAHLENLGALSVMAFDKTGTLTGGQFNVAEVVPLGAATREELLRVAAAVEQQSNHPLALAVVRAAEAAQLTFPAADGLENVVGRGVRSTVEGAPVLIGSLRLFRETEGHALPEAVVMTVDELEQSGHSTMAVSRAGEFLGVLGLADTLRPNVPEVMRRLREQGVKHLVMLTGDNQDVAERIAAQVGVTDVRAELLPEDKLKAIRALEAQYGPVAMTGDGVNDAPALATATVGIAMGGAGTAVALETADVALMGDDLGKLPFAAGLSRASRAIIRQNLAISLGVIALLMVTSVFGLVELGGAVILHEGSTILVVLNALRLLAYGGR